MTSSAARRARRALLALAIGGGLIVAAGCGAGDPLSGDAAAGKDTFKTHCASCHTLAEAGTPPSYIGPDLDDAFRASREAGIDDAQFAGVVERWITEAQLPMPRDLVKGDDAKNVAAYIASVAGTTAVSPDRPAQTTPEVPNPPRQEQDPS
jgi:mono/diheme cytochrome c family protein